MRATKLPGLAMAALLLLLLLTSTHGSGSAGARPSRDDTPSAEQKSLASAIKSYVGQAKDVISAAQTAYELYQDLTPHDGKVEVKFGVNPGTMTVDVGTAYSVPFEFDYSFKAGIFSSNVFAEFYVFFNDSIIYFKRLPQSGFFSATQAGVDKGSVWIGAKHYTPHAPADNIRILGVLYSVSDAFKDYHRNQAISLKFRVSTPTGESYENLTQPYHYIEGWGVDPPGMTLFAKEIKLDTSNPEFRAYYLLDGLSLLSKSEQTFQVEVNDLFYVAQDSTKNDNGKTKNHHDGDFYNNFTAWAQYRYAINPITQNPLPEPPEANVTVQTLPAEPSLGELWHFASSPQQFKLAISATQPSSQYVAMHGRHGNADTGHPNQTAHYAGPWSVSATGSNHIQKELPLSKGKTDLEPFTWETLFRVAPNVANTLPLTYTAVCVDPEPSGGGGTPQTAASTDTPSATATPTPTATSTPTVTATPTVTPTATSSVTATSVLTPTVTPTEEHFTLPYTDTPTPTATRQTFTLPYTATPTATPTAKATVQEVPGATVKPPAIGFGYVPVGTASGATAVTLTNTGNAPLAVASVVVVGTGSGSFTLGAAACATLVPGQSCAVDVTYKPTAPGPASANLEFTDNAPGSPQAVALSGEGTEPPSVNGTDVSIGTVLEGQSETVSVKVTNVGKVSVTVGAFTITGSNLTVAANGCTGTTLAPGGSCGTTLDVTGATLGTFTDTVSIGTSPAGGLQPIDVQGDVIPALAG